ncbi:HAD-IIIA family hydrolase [Solirubrobacter sp. CPCC 204708]|uniref:D,D-heptose 1,7-bisphosphate phosphatase n=1 Tax=Solirubrobacter deserti TaxID=2282478 RepID=A0ABT4RLF7_9ACTN|nr:HAD-IIIA family hydrolase [Solirubrobacter deserti]MBE2320422.1 HAD-IIIA family hydrolase [Solirubrobacter deserti]MDA0139387.1 HAD-IIIA family hydrolase [Solirubrobacter deserti]
MKPLPLPSAVLLDRDGTINVKAPEGEYVTAPAGLRLIAGAAGAIRAFNRAGVPVAVVTNQRGIARGLMSEQDLEAVHARLEQLLEQEGAFVDAIFHCPHEKGTCACRKPGTELLERARRRFGLATLADAVMIGDADSDVLAGHAAGARTVLLRAPAAPRPVEADEVAVTLAEAAERLLARHFA